MNFLSHLYFERKNQDENMVIGTVLPDLVKNANKSWNFYPHKNEDLFRANPAQNSLLQGWKKHLQVDLYFHSSDFFKIEMAKLKQLILPILDGSPVRPSFLAHIGVELVLDHLLVEHNKVNIYKFYDHLDHLDEEELKLFLKNCGCTDIDKFLKFFSSFKSSRYLLSYQKLDNISYALQRICMRLWAHPFDEKTVGLLTVHLEVYKQSLADHYLSIFDEIEGKLIS